MIAFALLTAVVVSIYGLWRAWPLSGAQRQGWSGVWRLACVIATVRIGAFAIGALLLRDSDWRQSLGYVLVLVGLPEIYAAKIVRSHPKEWFGIGCALLAGSSILWAGLFRFPYRSPMKQAPEAHRN